MPGDDLYRHMDAARAHAGLTVQDVWLRYVALGGTGDAFDLDGYLQGVVPLEAFQQDVLAQALNEALTDVCQAYRVPLSAPAEPAGDEDHLRGLVERLLDELPAHRADNPPRRDDPA